MTNRKTTKKALLGSLLALVLCFSMLVGTTFAWFTDNEVLANNKITAGTLDIAVAGDQTLFQADDILWEPGFSAPFNAAVENVGSLWLKYALVFDNIKVGDNWGENETADPDQFGYADITEVLDVYTVDGTLLGTVRGLFENGNMAIAGTLAPEDATIDNAEAADGKIYDTKDDVSFVIKMRESAGNEYKGAWAKFDVKVVATQYTAEKDGFDNNMYDEDATYDYVQVNNEAELAAALYDGQNVVVKENITVENTMAVIGSPIITLEGTINATANNSRPFKMTDGATLTINAENQGAVNGAYGLIDVPANTQDATIVINGGTFTGDSIDGAFIKVRANATANITLNDVNVTIKDGYVINSHESGPIVVNVNGGNFEAKHGFQVGPTAAFDGAVIKTKGSAIIASGEVVTVNNCEITAGTLTASDGAYAAAIGAGYGAKVIVNGGKINAAKYGLLTYPSAGEIVATDCDIVAAEGNYLYALEGYAVADYSKITVNGVVEKVTK